MEATYRVEHGMSKQYSLSFQLEGDVPSKKKVRKNFLIT